MRKKNIMLGLWGCTNAVITSTGLAVEVPLWIISALWSALFTAAVYEHLPEIKAAWRRMSGKKDELNAEDVKQINSEGTMNEHGVITYGPTGYPERLTPWEDMKNGKLAPPPGGPLSNQSRQ